MKVLVITGSRADRNGLEVVHEALLKAGHESRLFSKTLLLMLELAADKPDVVVVGGDRSEILQVALICSMARIPIAHIAGGDVTEGSADNRYRDAITALSCIHCTTIWDATDRVSKKLAHRNDCIRTTGSPAIDRIKQTPVLSKEDTWLALGLLGWSLGMPPTALVCVHPNTVEPEPMTEAWAVCAALSKMDTDIQCICLGSNADPGGESINAMWRDWKRCRFVENLSPQLYYSLMTHCDVMIGNSSAMLYEAPCFGLPCILVGERQKGRIYPSNVYPVAGNLPREVIRWVIERGRVQCENPYGDGHSAPRIVEALEENSWRWSSKDAGVFHKAQQLHERHGAPASE